MVKKMMSNPIHCFDITIHGDVPSDKVRDYLSRGTKRYRWVYQKEQGSITGYTHYQCRVSYLTKKRFDTVQRELLDDDFNKFHLSPTSASCKTGDRFYDYCTKDHTRIEGPFSVKDKAN